MLFNPKTNGFETRDGHPNDNWKNDSEWIVVDDNSDFAKTIFKNYPNIRCNIENGEIKSVIVTGESEAKENIATEVAKAKKLLRETDYKVIKSMEYNMAGLPLPYDIQKLHNDRQALRDKINELEESV